MKRRHSKRKIKKNLLAAVLLIGIIAVAGILICALQVPEVTFSESLRFPVGTKLVLSDVVENVKFGKLTEPDMPLDSSKEGLVKFTFNTANLLKIKSEKEIMIDFYKPESPKSEEKTDPVEKPDQNDAPTLLPLQRQSPRLQRLSLPLPQRSLPSRPPSRRREMRTTLTHRPSVKKAL